jgi:hypothetical protein
VLSSLNNELYVGGLFCDLQKAFDCVNHQIFKSKLKFYSISGVPNRLIKSYLLNRYQRVIINDNNLNKISSRWEEVKYGVPQGSILSPLFFFFYIVTISQKLKLYLRCLILRYLQTIRLLSLLILLLQNSKKYINQLLIETNKLFQSNMLYLNYEKNHFMQFLTKKNKEIDIQVSFANKQITDISR